MQEKFLLTLFSNSMVTGLIIVLLYFILRSLKSTISAKSIYVVWVVVAISLVLPFRSFIDFGLINLTNNNTVQTSQITTTTSENNSTNTTTNEVAQNTVTSANNAVQTTNVAEISFFDKLTSFLHNDMLYKTIFYIWLLGFAFVLIRYFYKYFMFKKSLSRWSKEITDENILSVYEDIKFKLNISDNIKLIHSPLVHSPMLAGILNQAIVIPSLDVSSEELELILEHELTHYKHKDLYANFIGVLAVSIHWFNPLAKICYREIQEISEIYCDTEVLRNKNKVYRKFYGETIISMIEKKGLRQVAFTTCFYSNKISLKRRITNIMHIKNNFKKISAIITVVLVSVVVLAGSIMMFSNSSAQATINEQSAKELALKDAGLNESDVTFLTNRKEFDNNREVYKVEFYNNNVELEYVIDAKTGEIIKKDYDIDHYTPQNNNTTLNTNENSAKETALKDAGVNSSNANVKVENENGKQVYEVEFYNGNQKYDYKIDAATGQIISKEVDNKTYSAQTSTSQPATTSKSSANTAVPNVPAGATVEYDNDNGVPTYEVEYRNGNAEHSYKVNANTGAVIEREVDYDNDVDDDYDND